MPRLSFGLLDQAELLARKERHRPLAASLRRSISTSYYALFHYLLEESAGLIVGTASQNGELRTLLARAAVHGTMKRACQEVRKVTLAHPFHAHFASLPATGSAELRDVAKAFVELQELRHIADYDVNATLKRSLALWSHARAEAAFKSWQTLKKVNRRKALFFALLLFHYETLSKRK